MRIPPPRFFLWMVLLSPVLVIGFTASMVASGADWLAAWCQKIWLDAYGGK